MFPYNQNDKLIFVNIKNSYEAMVRNDVPPLCIVRNSMIVPQNLGLLLTIRLCLPLIFLDAIKVRLIEVVRINRVMPVTTG